MQELELSIVGSGGRVYRIDLGKSSKKTCEMIGGQYIEFKPNSHIGVNPFTFITDMDDSMEMLKGLFCLMASPSGTLTDLDKTLTKEFEGE